MWTSPLRAYLTGASTRSDSSPRPLRQSRRHGKTLCVLRATDEVLDDVLGESATHEEPPPPRAIACSSGRPPRPPALRLALARRLDRLGDDRLRDPARDELRFDAEAPRATRPQRARSVVGERDIAPPAELAAARDRRRRR